MTEPTPADYAPVRVHVESSDVQLAGHAPPKLVITTRTLVLTAARPIDELAFDPGREYAIIQVFGNTAVLCTSLTQAQDPANAVAGLPNASGALLTVGQVIPLKAINHVWFTAAAFPTQISVIVAHKAP